MYFSYFLLFKSSYSIINRWRSMNISFSIFIYSSFNISSAFFISAYMSISSIFSSDKTDLAEYYYSILYFYLFSFSYSIFCKISSSANLIGKVFSFAKGESENSISSLLIFLSSYISFFHSSSLSSYSFSLFYS